MPARRRGLVPAETSLRTAVRKTSNAAASAVSRRSAWRESAFGGWRVQKPGTGAAVLRRVALQALPLKAPCVDFAFQPANHHVFDSTSHGRVHLARSGEAHRIEHLQQTGERAGVAVVRGCGEEEPVLELRRHESQHAAKLAVFAERRRHQVVALVDDQQIPRQVRGALGGAAGRQELFQHIGLAQVVVGGDDAAERAPGIRVHAEPAAQALGCLAVHDLEPEGELVPELFLPLPAQRRGGEDEDTLDAAPEQQLGEDQPRLDGLAEADVVGDEEAYARHAQRLEEWDELVALDAYAAMERACDGLSWRGGLRLRRGPGRARGPTNVRPEAVHRSPPPAWRRRRELESAGRSAPAGDGPARSPTGCVLRTAPDRPCIRGGRDGDVPSRRRRARRPRPLRAGCGRSRACRREGRRWSAAWVRVRSPSPDS